MFYPRVWGKVKPKIRTHIMSYIWRRFTNIMYSWYGVTKQCLYSNHFHFHSLKKLFKSFSNIISAEFFEKWTCQTLTCYITNTCFLKPGYPGRDSISHSCYASAKKFWYKLNYEALIPEGIDLNKKTDWMSISFSVSVPFRCGENKGKAYESR